MVHMVGFSSRTWAGVRGEASETSLRTYSMQRPRESGGLVQRGGAEWSLAEETPSPARGGICGEKQPL